MGKKVKSIRAILAIAALIFSVNVRSQSTCGAAVVKTIPFSSYTVSSYTASNYWINIYPNPNNGDFTLEYALKENAVIEITDISGKLVDRYNLNATEKKAEIHNDKLENGIYLYRMISSNGQQFKAGKIVIFK